MLHNSRITDFRISELLRENQQGGGGKADTKGVLKLSQCSQENIRVGVPFK